eukprot:1193871-Prorocentrum_minimum.AAC.2
MPKEYLDARKKAALSWRAGRARRRGANWATGRLFAVRLGDCLLCWRRSGARPLGRTASNVGFFVSHDWLTTRNILPFPRVIGSAEVRVRAADGRFAWGVFVWSPRRSAIWATVCYWRRWSSAVSRTSR